MCISKQWPCDQLQTELDTFYTFALKISQPKSKASKTMCSVACRDRYRKEFDKSKRFFRLRRFLPSAYNQIKAQEIKINQN